MKMEFIFDNDKLKENGYKEEQCLNAIRNYFKSYESETVKEISKGVFEGEDDDWEIFAATPMLLNTSWFLKVIKEWYWYIDEEDGLGEQKEDCLASYYKIKSVKA